MVSWALVPLALIAGVIFGFFLYVLVSSGQNNDQ